MKTYLLNKGWHRNIIQKMLLLLLAAMLSVSCLASCSKDPGAGTVTTPPGQEATGEGTGEDPGNGYTYDENGFVKDQLPDLNYGYQNAWTFSYADRQFADAPMAEPMKAAKECGVKFTFGTDSHMVDGLASIRQADLISEVIGIGEQDLADVVRI